MSHPIRLTLLSLLVSLISFAKPPSVEFVQKKGEPLRIALSDGRIATLMLIRRPVFQFPLGIQVTDNTCSDTLDVKARLYFALWLDELVARWTMHPDKSKIGKDVVLKFVGGGRESFHDYSFITNADRKAKPKLAGLLPQDRVEAKDFSWLPNASKLAPLSLRLVRWDTEAMRLNPETGQMENRTISVMTHLFLKRTSPSELTLVDYGGVTATNLLRIFSGDIWAWVVRNEEGYCLISLKMDFTSFLNSLQKLSPGRVTPYLFGSDEYSDVAIPPTQAAFRKNPAAYELE